MLFFDLLIVLLLFCIFIQDMKSRSVYWFWFPLLAVLFVGSGLLVKTFPDFLEASLVNIAFIVIQLGILTLYFCIKQRSVVNLMNDMLGWGDVLFLLTIALYLSPLNFIVFYIFSLIAILALWVSPLILLKKKYQHIPLAGLQSLIFIVCLVADWLSPRIDLLHDDWLMHFLLR